MRMKTFPDSTSTILSNREQLFKDKRNNRKISLKVTSALIDKSEFMESVQAVDPLEGGDDEDEDDAHVRVSGGAIVDPKLSDTVIPNI